MTETPRATYRLQLGPDLSFDDATALVGQLADLGVSHLYLSPVLQATSGSTHGYDVTDPTKISDDLGGEAGLRRLADRAHEAGMGIVVDVVPNHVAAVPENPWWWDVLEQGPASVHARVFDIDWDPPESKLRNRVLVPILGDHLGRVLANGELSLERHGVDVRIAYHEHRLPTAPRSLAPLVARAAAEAGSEVAAFLADALAELPEPGDEARWTRRQRDHRVVRSLLERALDDDPRLSEAYDAVIAAVSTDPAELAALLEQQNHRLAFWRTGYRELDYRRFFDIDQLVGVRVEDPAVFEATHRVLLDLIADGVVDGVRIDHPDGLRDPAGYLERLQAETGGCWCVVEKILEPGEELPDWPVAGTTGYDFARHLTGVLLDPAGEKPFAELAVELVGDDVEWEELVRGAKIEVLRGGLAADVTRLVELFVGVCESSPLHRDYTRFELDEAVVGLASSFGVYRTYRQAGDVADQRDRDIVEDAVRAAQESCPELDPDLIAFLGSVLTGDHREGPADELAQRFQQLTGPAMAKGVEDTAGYRQSRFVLLSEVGGDPGGWSSEPEAFHRAMAHDASRWPATMRTTSTHDTKRSEDVRARLLALAEVPDRWREAVTGWMAATAGEDVPDDPFRYRWFQTVVGAHPLSVERALVYAEKASREAKEHTSWTDQDADYEAAVERFVRYVADDPALRSGVADLVEAIADAGWANALAQVVVKLTAPGVPDLYQGTESWDLSLVDPDNRRPVDWAARREQLARVATADPAELWERRADGDVKAFVTRRILEARRDDPERFSSTGYRPLTASGDAAAHLLAFSRDERLTAAVTRLPIGLERRGGWGSTRLSLPPGSHRNLFTGASHTGDVAVAELLGPLPVAVLIQEES